MSENIQNNVKCKREIKIGNIYPDTRNEDKILLESKLAMKRKKLQPTPQK